MQRPPGYESWRQEIGTEIGFGIVGAGMVARYHAQAVAETPGARLTAILLALVLAVYEAAGLGAVPPGSTERVKISCHCP